MALSRAFVACAGVAVVVSAADPAPVGKKTAAVEKAVQLLSDLQTKVLHEGEAEAKTYGKFACFCQDTTKDKLDAIQKGEDAKDLLVADIQALQSKRDGLDTTIKDAQDAIKNHEDDMHGASTTRGTEVKLYEENSADLRAAVEALAGALKALKASKPASFLQSSNLPAGVRAALSLADAMGLGGSSVAPLASALLQTEQPIEDYKFKSDSVISTLEGLQKDFRDKREEVDAAEVEAVSLHDKFMQEKSDLIKQETVKMETAKKDKEETVSDLASSSQRLSLVSATLMDDKEYASELSKMCADKARTWDQRSQMRADEVQVLTQAIGIVQTTVSEKTSAATIRFAQQGVSLRRARSVARDDAAMESIEAAAEAEEAPRAVSLLAVARRHRAVAVAAEPDAGKRAVESLLRSRGMQLKSALLTALASQISEDPFSKVKTLVQELITRLQKEAANEATQKGWCDKAIAEAKQKRDYASEEANALNGQLAQLEALRAQLTVELRDLGVAIQKIKDDQQEATTLRGEEKVEHAAIVTEAQEGLGALNIVIDVLEKFYKMAKKAEVAPALVQRDSPNGDAPDAGFDNNEAYNGAQGDAGGVLGMLEVMKSDFTRTVTETQAAEKEAEQDHLEFMTETGKSMAEKEAAEKEKTRQLSDADQKFDDAKANLDAEMGTLTASIKELLELQPACVDTGMSYDDRVSHRQEELESLQKALCILGAFSQYGPDGAAGACQ